jgi:hypothetical protein
MVEQDQVTLLQAEAAMNFLAAAEKHLVNFGAVRRIV